MSKILFVGGGSLGHIVPSVAVWEELQEHSDSQAHFVCSPSALDTGYVQKLHLPYSTIAAPRLGISLLWKYWKAVAQANAILTKQQPDVIFSKGGYVSVPLCYAAKKKNIPIILHESDAVMGNANKLIANWAMRTCSGNPIRKTLTEGSKEQALHITHLQQDRPTLLVIGGSQGAEAINQAIIDQLDDILKHYQVIHISGTGKSSSHKRDGYFSTEFADEELAHFYAAADIAISRASASVTTELAANGIPAILVPLRGVGHDHQQKNAEELSKKDNFVLLQQSELCDKLIPVLEQLLASSVSRIPYPVSHESAANRIAEIILEVLASPS